MSNVVPMPERLIHFQGACHFLLCLNRAPHDHPICRGCGAVNYGNLNCVICRGNSGRAYRDALIEQTLGYLRTTR